MFFQSDTAIKSFTASFAASVWTLNARRPVYRSRSYCRLCRIARDGPFGKIGIQFLAARVLYSKAMLSREHSGSCCIVHSLQHLRLSVAHEVYLRSLFDNSTALE